MPKESDLISRRDLAGVAEGIREHVAQSNRDLVQRMDQRFERLEQETREGFHQVGIKLDDARIFAA